MNLVRFLEYGFGTFRHLRHILRNVGRRVGGPFGGDGKFRTGAGHFFRRRHHFTDQLPQTAIHHMHGFHDLTDFVPVPALQLFFPQIPSRDLARQPVGVAQRHGNAAPQPDRYSRRQHKHDNIGDNDQRLRFFGNPDIFFGSLVHPFLQEANVRIDFLFRRHRQLLHLARRRSCGRILRGNATIDRLHRRQMPLIDRLPDLLEPFFSLGGDQIPIQAGEHGLHIHFGFFEGLAVLAVAGRQVALQQRRLPRQLHIRGIHFKNQGRVPVDHIAVTGRDLLGLSVRIHIESRENGDHEHADPQNFRPDRLSQRITPPTLLLSRSFPISILTRPASLVVNDRLRMCCGFRIILAAVLCGRVSDSASRI